MKQKNIYQTAFQAKVSVPVKEMGIYTSNFQSPRAHRRNEKESDLIQNKDVDVIRCVIGEEPAGGSTVSNGAGSSIAM